MKRANAWALSCILASAIGCATLPSVPEGTCGNLVVDANEDCEHYTSEEGTRCGSEGKAACRFVCGKDADNAHCPAGFGCGTDGICRAATGRFSHDRAPTFTTNAGALGVGDFDGDGLNEIVAKGKRVTTVIGLDPDDALGQRAAFFSTGSSFPAIGHHTASGLADLALVGSQGFISLWRGQPNGELASTFYAAFPVDGDEFTLMTAEVLPGSMNPLFYGLEVLVAVRLPTGLFLAYVRPPTTSVPVPLARLSGAPSTFAGTQRAARFDENLPCDSQVLAFQHAAGVEVLPLCRTTNSSYEPNELLDGLQPSARYVSSSTVTVPGDYTVGAGGVLVADFDLDGHLDLVINGDPKKFGEQAMLVAYGLGDGHFDSVSWKGKPKPSAPSNSAGIAPTIDCPGFKQRGFPLALGHLTAGDDRIDGVFDRGVCYRVVGDERFLSVGAGLGLRSAAIGDINANGLADVVAASESAIEILSSTGTYAYRSTVPTSAQAENIALGDVDGDLVQDIAYKDRPNDAESVYLMFGRPLAAPEPPILLGAPTGQTTQILIGPVNAGDADELGDVGVVSKNTSRDPANPYSVALLRGTTNRQLEAPFSIVKNGEGPERNIQVTAKLVVSGHFTTSKIDAIVAVAQAPADDPRLWLVPMLDGAEPDLSRIKPSSDALESSRVDMPWEYARALAVDLDAPTGDGVQEVVLVAAVKSAANATRAWIGRMSSAGDAFTVKAIDIGGGGSLKQPVDIVSADFDGDGLNDIAVLSVIDTKNTAVVLFNDGAGGLGGLTPLEFGRERPTAIATCALSVGKKSLMVAWSDNTVRPVTFDVRRPRVEASVFEASSVEGMVGGDIDGDGVDDLAVAQGGTVTVHYGAPAKP